MPKTFQFLTFINLHLTHSHLRELLEILVVDLVLRLQITEELVLVVLARVLEPLLIHNLLAKLEFAEMLEITLALSTKRTEEAGNVANTFRISLIVNSPVKMLIINLLDFQAIILIFDIMLEVADITSASAGVIAIFGHNFDS
jgi:hypothetical protein